MLLLAAATPAPAQGPGDEALNEIATAIEFAQQQEVAILERQQVLTGELADLRGQSIATSQAILQLEQRIAAIGADIATLEDRANRQRLALAAGQERMATLAMGLQRLARLPLPVLAAADGLSDDVIRGALLLNAVIEPLEAEAAAIRRRIDDLAATLAALDTQRRALGEAIVDQEREIAGLDQLMLARQALLVGLEGEADRFAERARSLAASAEDVRGLVRGLDAESDAASLEALISDTRLSVATVSRLSTPAAGSLAPPPEVALVNGALLPAVGAIEVPFGGIDRYGRRSQGIALAVGAARPVIAPADGTVRYAGPFRGFGLIVVIDHGNGLFATIAGLGRADVVTGQAVLAGEPIAVTLPQTDDSRTVRLYFETRRDGDPVNPLIALADL